MFRKIVILVLVAAVFSSCNFKQRSGYYYNNNWFNYVRAEKLKGIDEGTVNHPYAFTEPQISTILKMIEVKKGTLFSKNEKIKNIFDTYSISKLTPAIVKAFSDIGPEQRVGFAFMIKDPLFVIKNDRFTNGWMWVQNGRLHIEFDMVYAKVTGDTDRHGYQSIRQINSAKGLRVTLDTQPGQELGDSTKELVVDLGVTDKIVAEVQEKEAKLAEMGIDDTVKIKVVKEGVDSQTITERMKELETLKKERMITEEEYEQKRKALLGEL